MTICEGVSISGKMDQTQSSLSLSAKGDMISLTLEAVAHVRSTDDAHVNPPVKVP